MRGPEYLVFPLALVALVILVYGTRRGESWFRTASRLGTATYVAAVAAVTFFPLPVQQEVLDFERRMQFLHNQFAIFGTIGPALAGGIESREMVQALANVVMFLPVGILVPILSGPRRAFVRTLIVALIAAALIEAMQYAISRSLGFTYKITDVDDIILNVIGAMIGFGLFRVLEPIVLVRVGAARLDEKDGHRS